MVRLTSLTLVAVLGGALSVLAAPAEPLATAKPDPAKRATTCTFSGSNGAASASASKTACSTIILSAIAVPSGVTLDLTGLTKGTHVIFEGTTTFGYEEWAGPLVSVSGTDITVTAASGAVLNGDGKGNVPKLRSNGSDSLYMQVADGGTARALTAARPSRSSSTLTI